MSASPRFLFENDFRAPPAGATKPSPEPQPFEPTRDEKAEALAAEHAKAIETAAAQAYAKGRAEALQEASEMEEARLNRLMERVDSQLAALAADASARMSVIEREAALLGVDSASALSEALVADKGELEVSAFFASVMVDCLESPKIAVTLNPVDATKARPILSALAKHGGYEGKMAFMTDDTMMRGDCRLAWQGGGARRDSRTVADEIRQMITSHFGIETHQGADA